MSEPLEIKAALQIRKPAQEVFEAIVDPGQMSNYFISESTGRMEQGKTLIWKFPEFTMEVSVRVGEILPGKLITYAWDGENGRKLTVQIGLASSDNESTIVTVVEKSMPNDDIGIKWLKSNTEGWANFLACLKAWLEYGINLREGAFDFRSDKV